jgi:hypothetical protein
LLAIKVELEVAPQRQRPQQILARWHPHHAAPGGGAGIDGRLEGPGREGLAVADGVEAADVEEVGSQPFRGVARRLWRRRAQRSGGRR